MKPFRLRWFNVISLVTTKLILLVLIYNHNFNLLPSNVKLYCSAKAHERGPHQRIFSYSLYGNLSEPQIIRRYVEPLREAIKYIATNYPGWFVRIYHNSTADDDTLENLFPNPGNVDLCDSSQVIRNFPIENRIFEMTWRWFPLLDDMVDIMMSRDSDTPIIDRETIAVREWLESNYTFHAMRDHPMHCIEMLGGMWGVKLNQNRKVIQNQTEVMFSRSHNNHYSYDQYLLTTLIWPIAQHDVLAHDSYCCQMNEGTRPFPTQREGREFVGMTGWPDDSWSFHVCPEKCRKFSNWNYC